jgi:hypothetical protein
LRSSPPLENFGEHLTLTREKKRTSAQKNRGISAARAGQIAKKACHIAKKACHVSSSANVFQSAMDFTPDIEFGRFADLERRFSIKRSTAYALIEQGKIRTRYVRPKGSRHGVRLIDFHSVREFLGTAPDQPPGEVCAEMTRRAFASADARKAAKNGGEMSAG